MFLYTTQVNQFLSILTIISQVVLILFVLMICVRYFADKKIRFFEKIVLIFRKHSLHFAFVIALVATSGSLFFSEIAGYTPCELCWFQRIFMYPMVLLLGIAIWNDDFNIKRYILPMSIIGAGIGFYQYIGTITKKAATTLTCSLIGPSCFVDYFKEYGYVTITLMAITAFIMIFTLTLFMDKNKK